MFVVIFNWLPRFRNKEKKTFYLSSVCRNRFHSQPLYVSRMFYYVEWICVCERALCVQINSQSLWHNDEITLTIMCQIKNPQKIASFFNLSFFKMKRIKCLKKTKTKKMRNKPKRKVKPCYASTMDHYCAHWIF